MASAATTAAAAAARSSGPQFAASEALTQRLLSRAVAEDEDALGWDFVESSRPTSNAGYTAGLALLTAAVLARAVYFFRDDPASQAIGPLHLWPLTLQMLPAVVLGAAIACLGASLLLRWTRSLGAGSLRVYLWLFVAFQVITGIFNVAFVLAPDGAGLSLVHGVGPLETPGNSRILQNPMTFPPRSVVQSRVSRGLATAETRQRGEASVGEEEASRGGEKEVRWASVPMHRVLPQQSVFGEAAQALQAVYQLGYAMPAGGALAVHRGMLASAGALVGQVKRGHKNSHSGDSGSEDVPSEVPAVTPIYDVPAPASPAGMRVFTALTDAIYAGVAIFVAMRFSRLFSDVGRLIGTTSCVLLNQAYWVPFGTVTVCALLTAAVTIPLYALGALIAESCKALVGSLSSHAPLPTLKILTALLTTTIQTVLSPNKTPNMHLVNTPGTVTRDTINNLGGALSVGGAAYPPASPERCTALVAALVPTEVPELLFTILFAFAAAWLLALLLCALKFLASHAVCHQLAGEEPLDNSQQKASLCSALCALKGSLGPLCYVSLVLSTSFLFVYALTALLFAGEGNPALMVPLLVVSKFALVAFDLFLSGFVVPLLAFSGKRLAPTWEKAWQLMRAHGQSVLSVWVLTSSVVMVLTLAIVLLYNFLEMPAAILLTLLQGPHAGPSSSIELSLVSTLPFVAFADVFSACVFCSFVCIIIKGRIDSPHTLGQASSEESPTFMP